MPEQEGSRAVAVLGELVWEQQPAAAFSFPGSGPELDLVLYPEYTKPVGF